MKDAIKTVVCIDKDKNKFEVPVKKLSFRPSVYGVIIKDDKILLSRQWDGYAFPGGGIELGEDMHEALGREMLEETGLQVKVGEIVACENSFFKWEEHHWHTILIFLSAEVVGGTLSIDGVEEIERDHIEHLPEWVPLADIKKIKFYTSFDSLKVIQAALKK